jgi:hypothetical protein
MAQVSGEKGSLGSSERLKMAAFGGNFGREAVETDANLDAKRL